MEIVPIRSIRTLLAQKKRLLPLLLLLTATVILLCTAMIARKQVTLSVDGEIRKLSTFGRNVSDVLQKAGVQVGPADFLSYEPGEKLRSGMKIEIRRAFPVTVNADGTEFQAFIVEATVAEVLDKLGLTLGPFDRIEPAMEHQLKNGETIKIVRVERLLVTQRTEIPFREIRRGNTGLDRGDSRVIARGIPGLREDTLELTLEDGKEVSAKIVQSEMIRVKQDRVVEYGENTVLSRGGRSIGFHRVFTMHATAYCAGTAETQCPVDGGGRSRCTGKYNDGITASGRPAIAGTGREDNPHLVAVDPRVIPLGSRLYIDGFGYAVAADTGGAIKGNRIDILFDNHFTALQFGRKTIRVYLLP